MSFFNNFFETGAAIIEVGTATRNPIRKLFIHSIKKEGTIPTFMRTMIKDIAKAIKKAIKIPNAMVACFCVSVITKNLMMTQI